MLRIDRCHFPSFAALLLLPALFISSEAGATGKDKSCGDDGVHPYIDPDQVSLQYTGKAFSGTINSILALSVHLEAKPQTLQVAAKATQQWDVFLRGLVAGYNSCAVTRKEYYQGILQILKLNEDAKGLEQIRKELATGQKANEAMLQRRLDAFMSDFREFAAIGKKLDELDDIERLLKGVRKTQDANTEQLTQIGASVDEIKQELKQVLTPAEIESSVRRAQSRTNNSELTRQLQAWTDLAQREYRTGYNLLQQFSFSDAVPHLRKAYDAVRLPEFAVGLATALRPLMDLKEAEDVLQKGISDAASIQDEAVEAKLRRMLSRVLRDRGNLPEAKVQAELSVQLCQKLHGANHAETALAENDYGMILYSLEDYPNAKRNVESAMNTDIRLYGDLNQQTATDKGNLGLIYIELNDLPKAEELLQEALRIDTKLFGPDHITVATDSLNLSNVLFQQQNFAGAQRLIERSLEIDTGIFGPNHPAVAVDQVAYSEVLRKEGRISDAKAHFKIAISIYSMTYGPQDSRTRDLISTFETIFPKES